MKLISATIQGYKRFAQKSMINLDGKLIAIVGPNEAGKSSLLRVLQHLNHRDAFVKSGSSQEITRGILVRNEDVVIGFTFLLEESDKSAVAGVEDTEKIRWMIVEKRVDGGNYYRLSPTPERNLVRRRDAIVALQNMREAIQSSGIKVGPNKEDDPIIEVDNLISTLNVNEQRLSSEVIKSISSVATMFLSSGIAAAIEPLQTLAQELNELVKAEQNHPHDIARNQLRKLVPNFLFFDEEARNLQSEYDLGQVSSNPPVALANLVRLAQLDLNDLMRAIGEADHGYVETILEAANKQLEEVFSNYWSQAKVAVRLRVSQTTLYILVGGAGAGYVAIAERSDGLRQYVALVAFASITETTQVPILLIDELETHLHYDAQADLVQMLAKQKIASKVIYTTHSVGCLPEDLGTGVRLIDPNGSTTSKIQNWFWESDEPGFSPLLFGIGATTLAFLPVRFALITEGPTDIILLPTLFREVTGQSYLGFQVVPGLSVANETEIGMLENGAPRTSYLVDSDKGGRDLKRQLRQAGIPETRIFSLPDDKGLEPVLEDFIEADVYLQAVNEELRRSHGESVSFPDSDLPVTGRPGAVEEWCKNKSIKAPNKRAIAYRILEMRNERPILFNDYQTQFKQLYNDIKDALEQSKA
ncbi:MAG TPA: AAA family ATPase [Pyrinomonadaceae bacterium]|jgi:predicted ATP-dependent endonuclease of OLD family